MFMKQNAGFPINYSKGWYLAALAGLTCTVTYLSPAESIDFYSFEGKPLVQDARLAFPPSAPPLSAEVYELKIGFYNIEMFSDGIKDGKARTAALVTNQAANAAVIINELNPDVLLISEIENEAALQILNRYLPTPYLSGYVVEFATGSGRSERMNIGMLSRYLPESVQEVDFGPLTGPGRPTRGLFRAVFKLEEGRMLLVYACHLKANFGGEQQKNFAQRYHAMKILEEDAMAVTGARPDAEWEIMVFGDFNTDPLVEEFKEDKTLALIPGWTDLWMLHPDVQSKFSVPTRKGVPDREFPPVLFDRVLANPQVREKPWSVSQPEVLAKGTDTQDSKTLPGQGIHVSDHYPVAVTLAK